MGNAAKSPAPPSTSQVSLPSQTGATVFIITSRFCCSGKNGNRMPMPRSKPSSTTYINMPSAIIAAQVRVRSMSGSFDGMRGNRERSTRGVVVVVHARHAGGLARQRRTCFEQLEQVVDARPEHERVDHHEH